MKLKLYNVKRLRTGDRGVLSIEVPKGSQEQYAAILHKSPDYLDVEICTPTKHRTTGEKSQNHRINGFIQQMSVLKGLDFDSLKYYCKHKAISRGYPFDTFEDIVIPWSETRIDTIQAGMLIDTIEQIAAEQGGVLVEE